MKLIKTASNLQIKLSKSEWQHIGLVSGWIKKAEDIDLTRQKADTDKLFEAMKDMRREIGSIQNNTDPNAVQAIKLSILKVLQEITDHNWVARLDSEIGLSIMALTDALNKNDFIQFNQILEKKFKTDLDESKNQLNRQQAKQQGAMTGVQMDAAEVGGQ